MKAHIQYRIREVYGVEKMYPVNTDALMVCAMTRQKTITDSDMAILRKDNDVTFERVM